MLIYASILPQFHCNCYVTVMHIYLTYDILIKYKSRPLRDLKKAVNNDDKKEGKNIGIFLSLKML